MRIPEYNGQLHRYKTIIGFIRRFREANGYPPSVRELCVGLGLSSSSTVQNWLNSMERDGWITRTPTLSRSIRIAPDVPVEGGSTEERLVVLERENVRLRAHARAIESEMSYWREKCELYEALANQSGQPKAQGT